MSFLDCVQILEQADYQRRSAIYSASRKTHTYVMRLGQGRVIDATRKVSASIEYAQAVLPLRITRIRSPCSCVFSILLL